MKAYLKSIFGDITFAEYSFTADTPMFISEEYKAVTADFCSNKCIIVSPLKQKSLASIKKQAVIIKQKCGLPVAVCFETLRSEQRKNLINDKVPFIVVGKQAYLPFWGCAFSEKYSSEKKQIDVFSPAAQQVLLYLIYSKKQNVSYIDVAKALNISKATCTRAMTELLQTGMVTENAVGTKKLVCLACSTQETVRNAKDLFCSPVCKKIYVKQIPKDIPLMLGGINALSDISMINRSRFDGSYVIYKKNVSFIPNDLIISEQEHYDFGADVIEVWKYDPATLSDTNRVDDISLLLSLNDNKDERVQMCLDNIRNNYGFTPYE